MEAQLGHPNPPAPDVANDVKLVIGVFFTLLGALLALDNIDLLETSHLLRWWPLVLIVIGVLKLRGDGSRGTAVVSLTAGVLLLAANTLRVSIFEFWPLLLVGAGIVIVAKAIGFRPRLAPAPSGRSIVAILSTQKVERKARDVAGTNIVAFMGGCDLDVMPDGSNETTPVVIDVFTMWGGVTIRVPEGWDVVAEAVPFMAGVDVKARSGQGQRVVVRGLAWMAGIEIHTRPTEAV